MRLRSSWGNYHLLIYPTAIRSTLMSFSILSSIQGVPHHYRIHIVTFPSSHSSLVVVSVNASFAFFSFNLVHYRTVAFNYSSIFTYSTCSSFLYAYMPPSIICRSSTTPSSFLCILFIFSSYSSSIIQHTTSSITNYVQPSSSLFLSKSL